MKKYDDSLEEMEAQLEQWGERIDELSMEADQSDEAIRGRIISQIKSLRAKQDIVRMRLEKYKKAAPKVLEYV